MRQLRTSFYNVCFLAIRGMYIFIYLILFTSLFTGCATTSMVPTTLSETVQVVLEPVDIAGHLDFVSQIQDDEIKVIHKYKDGKTYKTGAPWKVPQIESMRQILQRYMHLKFDPIAEDSVAVRIILEKVKSVYQLNESATSTALKTLFGGGTSQATYYCSHEGRVEILNSSGEILLSRRIASSASSQDVEALGYVVDKKGSRDVIMGSVCNSSINRFTLQLDKLINSALTKQ